MMRRALLLALAAWACHPHVGLAQAEGVVAKAEIAKRTKPATVLVEAKPRFGSGFCVHESGLFVTNDHVVKAFKDGDQVTLVLNAGEENQKLLKAVVVRRDAELDLALLRAETDGKLPSLTLGHDDKLAELDEVISFGFPFGTGLAKEGAYPTISVNASNISSFRRDQKSVLNRIQVDGALNPGNSGGPVMARDGKVVGVVVSGIPGAGINMAIPVGHVRRFLDKPEILLSVPPIDPKDKTRPVEFKAVVASVFPSDKPYDIELVLNAGVGERRYPMKLEAGKYVAKAAAFRDDKVARPRIELRFPEESLVAPVENLSFSVGGKKHSLSQVRTVRFGTAPVVTLDGGQVLEGPLEGLDSLVVVLGEQRVPVKTLGASELVVTPAGGPRGSFLCTVVAKSGNKEIGRLESVRYLVGQEPGGIEALLKGKFVKPQAALKPAGYMKIVSTSGDFIGQGKTYNFDGKQLKMGSNFSGGVSVRVDPWVLDVCAAKGEVLKVGEYPGAKRFPFNEQSPGLTFMGDGRASNTSEGKFVVWELEMNGNEVVKCAIDFIQHSEGAGPALVGVVRFNSSFE